MSSKITHIDLGDEPPLTLGEDDPRDFSRRDVSLRWLVGTVATAVTSLALMGGALLVALDGRYAIEAIAAVPPPGTLSTAAERKLAEKGDRQRLLIDEAEEAVARRTVIEVSTVTRQGGEDIIKVRPYASVTANLLQTKAAITADVPNFDPAKFIAAEAPTTTDATDAIYDQAVDGVIKLSVASFPVDGSAAFDPSVRLTDEDVEEIVREARWAAVGVEEVQLAYAAPAGLRSDVGLSLLGAVAASSVNIVPENISELAKTSDEAPEEDLENELIEVVQPGDTLSKIMLGSGVLAADLQGIDRVLRSEFKFDSIKPGQILVIRFTLVGNGREARRRPSRLTIYEDGEHRATVALNDSGDFIAAQPFEDSAPKVARDEPPPAPSGPKPSIYASLYQTAVDNGVPLRVIEEIARAFSFDVDFNANVRPGDGFRVVYAMPAPDEPDAAAPTEILYAALTAGGVERRLYRYKTPDDSAVDYYDESGRSAQKFLLRKPMARGVFRSGFGMRRHPILRYRKMHSGVDWAAPRGTPIYSAGSGTVVHAGWRSGYGRVVGVQHKYGYKSRYAHMSRIADGITVGTKVKQGQVIGYVGTTGLSTGPHLHYELLVNDRAVNPLKIRLPRGRELAGETRDAFLKERARIDSLLQQDAPTQVARR